MSAVSQQLPPEPNTAPGGQSWSSWFLPKQAQSPSSPGPTVSSFGAEVSTGPQPTRRTLRHAQSLDFLGLADRAAAESEDRLASLNLRVSMPTANKGVPTVDSRGIRSRTMSSVVSLGLGSGTTGRIRTTSISSTSGPYTAFTTSSPRGKSFGLMSAPVPEEDGKEDVE
jgi:hypothetical protein